MSAPSLRRLQEWFAGAIMHPGPIAEGARRAPHAAQFASDGVGATLTSGPLASAEDRLALYQEAYQSRLVEVLVEDYPAVDHALGRPAFEVLCRDYIATHPSRSPSLNRFAQYMPAFAAAHGGAHAAFASELARLEWAIIEAIHAPEPETTTWEELQTISPERWATARLPASGAVRVLRFEHPVNRFFQAFRDGEEAAIPAPEPSATAVYRLHDVVWRMDLTPAMADLLEALFAGVTLEQALAAAAGITETEVAVWFRDWVAAGFFGRVELESTRGERCGDS